MSFLTSHQVVKYYKVRLVLLGYPVPKVLAAHQERLALKARRDHEDLLEKMGRGERRELRASLVGKGSGALEDHHDRQDHQDHQDHRDYQNHR